MRLEAYWTPHGWQVDLDGLAVIAENPRFEKGEVRARISVMRGSLTVGLGQVSLASDISRRRFLKTIAEKAPELSDGARKDIDRALIALEGACRKGPKPPPKTEPEPADFGPILDGAATLDAVKAHLEQYVILPNPHAYIAVTLWAAHTHVVDAAESTPRLAFLSPEPECGKTRALEVLELLVPRPMLAVNATPAALFRAVGAFEQRPTILFDEIDTIFGPKAKENEELRGLLNAGHRRSGVAYRCVGEGTQQEVKEFPAYAAVGLAGIGDLPDTILSRSIVIPMRQRKPLERVKPFRRREAEGCLSRLRLDLARWTTSVSNDLTEPPLMPAEVTDRAADIWEPLLALADAAGGDWPDLARTAAIALVAEKQDKEPSLGIRLLKDTRTVFGSARVDKLPTAALLEALYSIAEAPWNNLRGKPMDSRGLAQRLRNYGVRSKQLPAPLNVKGYDRADFLDAWERYLDPERPEDDEQESERDDVPPATEAKQAKQAKHEGQKPHADAETSVSDDVQVSALSETSETHPKQ